MIEKNLLLKISLPAVIVIGVLAIVVLSGQGPALAGVTLLFLGALVQAVTSASGSVSREAPDADSASFRRADYLVLNGWVIIAFGAFFSLVAVWPVPAEGTPKVPAEGWWIFSRDFLLQFFSGLVGAALTAAAAVFVLNRTNSKQQSLWDASQREEEARSSRVHHTHSAAELSEGVLKLRQAIFVSEQAVIDTAYLSSTAYIRWIVELYGEHEDFSSELSRWVESLHLDARALRNLRDHQPATDEIKTEFEKLRVCFDDNMVHFVRTITRWVAEEEARDKHYLALTEGDPGAIATRIREDLKVPATWLPSPQP